MTIAKDLREVVSLVKDSFVSLGLPERIDSLNSLIGAGEYELAYVLLCSNIHEFDMSLPPSAYKILEKIWPDIRDGVQKLEGPDWHYSAYLGRDAGSPAKDSEPVSSPKTRLKKQKPQESLPGQPTPPIFPWNSEPVGVREPGNVSLHENWRLTGPITAAFERLVQLGVQIYSVSDGTDYTFMVPLRLFAEQYQEIEKLLDVVAQANHSRVQHIDWYPHGHKLRINIPRRKLPKR